LAFWPWLSCIIGALVYLARASGILGCSPLLGL
jgi:hypothetical protein